MKRVGALLAALAMAGLATGCGDNNAGSWHGDVPSGFQDTATDGAQPETGDDTGPGDDTAPPDVGPDVVEALEYQSDFEFGDDHVPCFPTDHCTVHLSFTSQRTLKVLYTADGEPTANKLVSFALVNDDEGFGKLSALSSYTDSAGVAEVEVQSKIAAVGQFAVRASIDNPDVPPLYFDVVVAPKGQVPLTVVGKYAGVRPVFKYTVLLYRQSDATSLPDCSDIADLFDNETATIQSPPTNLTQTVKFNELPGLQADETQNYATIAYSENEHGAVLAWGCEISEVTYGWSSTTIIDMVDVAPSYRGTYKVTSYFDFVTALPEDVQPWVYTVLDFFQSPVGALLDLTCDLGGDVGFLYDICEQIFNDPDNPDIDELTLLGGLAVDILEALLNAALVDTPFQDVLVGGADVAQMIQSFEIQADLHFINEPADDGTFTEDDTGENWHTVVVKWSLHENCDPYVDPTCGEQYFSTNQINQGNAISGHFAGHMDDFWDMTIDMHPLALNYGALINYILENVAIPLMMGQSPGGKPIDSYDDMFKSLLAGKECLDSELTGGDTCCELFAQDVTSSPGGGALYGAAQALCESMITSLSDYIRDQLDSLTLETGNTVQIGTLTPCRLYDVDNDMVVDNMGTQNKTCTWEMGIEIFGAYTTIEADFWGVKDDY